MAWGLLNAEALYHITMLFTRLEIPANRVGLFYNGEKVSCTCRKEEGRVKTAARILCIGIVAVVVMSAWTPDAGAYPT